MIEQLILDFCSNKKKRRTDKLALCEMILTDGKPPEWIEIVPAGDKINALDGRKFSNSKPEAVVAKFNADPRKLPIDWEHSTEIKAPEGEEAPAAGWIVALEVRNGAIFAHVEWTKRGTESLTSKEYQYFSPAFLHDKAGIITEIVSGGLTNRPAFDMPEIAHELALCFVEKRGDKWVVLSESGDVLGEHDTEEEANKQLKAIEASKNKKSKGGSTASEEKTMDPKLLTLLGLAADATLDQVLAAISAMKTSVEKAAADLKQTQGELATARSQQPALDKFVPRADYDTALARASTAEKKIADDTKVALDKEIDLEIDAALKTGKITPATKEYHKALCSAEGGLARFKEFVKAAPVVGADSNLDDKGLPPKGESVVTEQALEIASRCGVTKEKYLAIAKAS